MRIILLTLILLLSACILKVITPSKPDAGVVVDAFSELQVLYHLAFEKHAYIQLEELYNLDEKTAQALRDEVLPAKHVRRVKRWHHKLRSYIVFLLTMQPTDDNGVIKTEMSSLLLHQLRDQSPLHIDLSLSNKNFYYSVRAGEVATTDSSEANAQVLFGDLLDTVLSMNEQAINKYYSMFAFERSEPVELCRKQKYDDCQEMQVSRSFSATRALARDKVTLIVNKTIRRLNKAVSDLQRLKVEQTKSQVSQEIGSHNIQTSSKYQEYELVLMNALQQGILPIFFTDIFKKMSGRISLGGDEEERRSIYKLLTEVSSYTITQAVVELKKELVTHWSEIRKTQRNRHRLDQKTIYLWLYSNEIAAARLLMQNPKHAPVVNYLFHRYEHEVEDRKLQKIIKAALSTVGIGTLMLFGASFTPLLHINAALSKAIIVSVAANFGWIGLSVSDSVVVRNRQLIMERALLSGSSRQVSHNLKLLQEFEAARKNAILSSTIGLSMSAGSYNQILKSLNSSSRPFLSNYIRNLFGGGEKTGEQPDIFIDP